MNLEEEDTCICFQKSEKSCRFGYSFRKYRSKETVYSEWALQNLTKQASKQKKANKMEEEINTFSEEKNCYFFCLHCSCLSLIDLQSNFLKIELPIGRLIADKSEKKMYWFSNTMVFSANKLFNSHCYFSGKCDRFVKRS